MECVRQLAGSGEFSYWYEIAFHLRHTEGLPQMLIVFEDRSLRSEIDEICADAQNTE